MADEIEPTEDVEQEGVEETVEVEETKETQGDDGKTKKKHRSPKHPEHASRQAARFRIERNQAREERDAARLELAFVKAAAGRFTGTDAAFKLADPALLSLDPERGAGRGR